MIDTNSLRLLIEETLNEELLKEGGAGGHMRHPFDLDDVKTGEDLVKKFEQMGSEIKGGNQPDTKIDGVNTSIKIIDTPEGKEFAMDRGSGKSIDVEGITTDRLPERFSAGHGMIPAGENVLGIFNDALKEQLRLQRDINNLLSAAISQGRKTAELEAKLRGATEEEIYKEVKQWSDAQLKIIEGNIKAATKADLEAKQAVVAANTVGDKELIKSAKDSAKEARNAKIKEEKLYTALRATIYQDYLKEQLRLKGEEVSSYKDGEKSKTKALKEELAARRAAEKAYNANRTFGDTPSFSGMGVGTFDNRGGGGFSGQFLGMADDLVIPDFIKNMGEQTVAAAEETKTTVSESVVDMGSAISSSFANFGQGIGDAIANGAFAIDNAGTLLLASFGDLLSSFGTALIAWGVGKLALDSLGLSGVGAIAAGTALVIAGKAISASASKGLQKVSKGVGGSVGGGGSSSFSGSSSRAVSTNSGGGNYVFEIAGTSLIGVLKNTTARNRALGGSLGI